MVGQTGIRSKEKGVLFNGYNRALDTCRGFLHKIRNWKANTIPRAMI